MCASVVEVVSQGRHGGGHARATSAGFPRHTYGYPNVVGKLANGLALLLGDVRDPLWIMRHVVPVVGSAFHIEEGACVANGAEVGVRLDRLVGSRIAPVAH